MKKIVLAVMFSACFAFVLGACSSGSSNSSKPVNSNSAITMDVNPSAPTDVFPGGTIAFTATVKNNGVVVSSPAVIWSVVSPTNTDFGWFSPSSGTATVFYASSTVTNTVNGQIKADYMGNPVKYVTVNVIPYNPAYYVRMASWSGGSVMGIADPDGAGFETTQLIAGVAYTANAVVNDLNTGLSAPDKYDYTKFVWTIVSGSGITITPQSGQTVTITVTSGAKAVIKISNGDATPRTYKIVAA
ncbi:MAG: hypothetical protein FWC57_06435 [Endomicrobia bacterium]|nr:hypothetical protein [Endomicrobiia bacterium]